MTNSSFQPLPFTGEHIKAYREDGFVLLKSFFTREEISAIQAQVQHFLETRIANLPDGEAYFEDQNDLRSLFRVRNLHKHDPAFAEFMLHRGMHELAEKFLEEKAQSKGLSLFGKAPRIGDETPPHQDNRYFLLEPAQALTLWIPIDTCDRGNGCVRFYRGSHRLPILQHESTECFGFSNAITDASQYDHCEEFALEVEPGDLIAHHCMTVHRADPNTSDRLRRALGITYYGKSAVCDEKAKAEHQTATHKKWIEAGLLGEKTQT